MNLRQIDQFIKRYPVGVGGILLAVILLLLIMDRSVDMPELEEHYAKLQRAKVNIDYNKKNGKTLAGNLAKAQEYLEEISKRLIDPENRTDNFKYLFNLEHKTGVKIENPNQLEVKPYPPRARRSYRKRKKEQEIEPNIVTVKYKVRAKGEYPLLLKLLYEVQKGFYFTRIAGISITYDHDKENPAHTMNIDYYFLGKPER